MSLMNPTTGIDYLMLSLAVLIAVILCLEFYKYIIPACKFVAAGYQMPCWEIYRRNSEDGGNQTFMGTARGYDSREALERFAIVRGFHDYDEMVRINSYPGMEYYALEVLCEEK